MIESAGGGVVRGHVAVVIGWIGVVCCSSSSPYSCLLHPSSPHFVTKNFLLRVYRCQSCHTFRKKKKKKRERRSAEMQNKQENTTVLNKRRRTICEFKCLLNCQLASFEALLSLEMTIEDPTPSWSAVPFFASCRTKTISVKIGYFPMFFVSNRKTCPVKEFSWSRTGAFFGTEKKAATHIPNHHHI